MLHRITLQIHCLIELIRILVTYWVVNLPRFFPSNFRLWRISSLGVLMLCSEWEKKLSDFGIGWSFNSFIVIGQLALCMKRKNYAWQSYLDRGGTNRHGMYRSNSHVASVPIIMWSPRNLKWKILVTHN